MRKLITTLPAASGRKKRRGNHWKAGPRQVWEGVAGTSHDGLNLHTWLQSSLLTPRVWYHKSPASHLKTLLAQIDHNIMQSKWKYESILF